MAKPNPSPPIILLAFANDARAGLELGTEQNAIWNELAGLDKEGVIQCKPISASLEQISTEFSRFNDRIYIFHYGGHSDGEFLHLLDTSSHAKNFGVQIGQQKNLKLAFLNGCRNYQQVETLHQLGVPVVIATTTQIKDKPAILLAQVFYRALAGGSNIGDSFERAKAHLFDKHPELQETYRGIGKPWVNGEDGSSWGIYPLRDNALNWSISDIETESRLELMSQLREASKTRHQKFIAPGGRFHHLHIDDAILTGIQDASRSTDGLIENNITLEGTPQPLFKSTTTLWEKPCPHSMLVGPGGMGKTVSLLRLWEHLAKPEEQDAPVPIFIQLNEFNNEPVADFIQKYIRKHYADIDPETLLKAERQNHPSIVLLLDGINEVTAQSNELLLEINRLKVREDYPGLQLILTSRVDMRTSHQWQDFHLLELQPLTDEQIIHYLKNQLPSDTRLLEVLRNPMMLSIYNAQSELPERYHAKGLLKENVTSTGEMLFNVEAIQRIKIEEQYATDLPEQAFRRFVLEHLLPFIGWEMQQAGQFFIQKKSEKEGLPGLEDILHQGIIQLRTDAFYETFEFFNEYLEDVLFAGELRRLFSKIIHKIAVEALVVLVRDGENYRFLHQNFRDYFAARHVQNQIRVALYQQILPEEMVKAPLDFYVRQLLGELEGEHTNEMVYDEKKGWHWSAKQYFLNNYLSNLLESCRGIFKQDRLRYIVLNILTILIEKRKEFSGADFHEICFKNFSINFHILSRPNLSTSFSRAYIDEESLFFQGHLGAINRAAFSLDGAKVVTASKDCTAKIWDALSGQYIRTLNGHKSAINSAVFNSIGDKVLTASDDKTARIWNSSSGKCILTLKGHKSAINSAVFSPIGDKIITASDDNTAIVWDAVFGEQLLTLKDHERDVIFVAFHPDGTKIYTASLDGKCNIWDALSGKKLFTPPIKNKDIFQIHTLKKDKIIAACNDVSKNEENITTIWDSFSGQCIFKVEDHSARVNSLEFHPDGSRFITASSDRTAKVWDTLTGQCLFTLKGHTWPVNYAVYNSDGSKIISASSDNTAKIWDALSGQCILTFQGFSQNVNCATVHPDGLRIITTSSDNTAKIWDSVSMRCVLTLKGHSGWIWSAAFNSDGSKIITTSSDNTTKVWDILSGQCIMTLIGHSDWVWSAAFSSDGSKIVTASSDKTAKVWDAITGQCFFTLRGHSKEVRSVAFNSDGSKIVTASSDNTAKVWNTLTGQCILTLKGHLDGIWSAVFNPNGSKIATASSDLTVKLWNSLSGHCISTLYGHPGRVLSACFHPNEEKIVSACSHGLAKIWDISKGQCIITLQGHSGLIFSATFHPNGKMITTASYDGTSKTWDAQTGKCLQTLQNISGLFIQGCDFRNLHPDSKLSPENIEIMRQYGAIFNDEDARQWDILMETHFRKKHQGDEMD